jgi:hypothetical protein
MDDLFAQLRSILEPHARAFKVTNRSGFYALDDDSIPGWSISFAAVVKKRGGKVSFYLLPTVYTPSLMDGVSKDLRAIRTRAGFFNFTSIDSKLFTELAALVTLAHETWDPKARTR